MDLHQASEILQKWSNEGNIVNRMWLYGSRVPGARRSPSKESDLDVAIEVLRRGSEDSYTRFFFDHKEWEESLNGQFPYKIHLTHYNSEVSPETPVEGGNVKKEVDRYGHLIYDRSRKNTS